MSKPMIAYEIKPTFAAELGEMRARTVIVFLLDGKW